MPPALGAWNLFFLMQILSLKKLFIYLFLVVLRLHCCTGFSLVAESGSYSPVVIHRLLMTVTPLVEEHRPQGTQASVVAAHALSSCGSWALEHRLSSCGAEALLFQACGIFPDQGSNPHLLHWHVFSLSLSHQGSPELGVLLTGLQAKSPKLIFYYVPFAVK